jgi:hypothetical protein
LENEPQTVAQYHEALNELLLRANLTRVDVHQLLDETIAASHNNYGLIAERRAKMLQQTASILLDRAKEHLDQNQIDCAVAILCPLLSRFDQAYWRLRRNLPAFPPLIEAFEMLVSLAGNEAAAHVQDQLFAFCLQGYLDSPVAGRTTMKTDWLFAMAHFAGNAGQQTQLIALCDAYESPHKDDRELMELISDEALQVKRIVYTRTKSRAVLREFLHANLHDDTCRKKAIAMAVEDGDHATAVNLCEERMEAAGHDDPNLSGWYRLLLQTASEAGDAEHIVVAAGWLFNRTEDFSYYLLLKKYTDPCTWAQEWVSVMENLRVKKNIGTLLQVLLEEDRHEHLPALLAALGVGDWFYYEKLLAQKCPAVLEKHFDLPVWNWLKWKTPGITEQDILGYLNRMRARFGEARVLAALQLMRAMCPRRQSLEIVMNDLQAKV